jgi:peptide/nickel transport system ATP-binding protein
VTAPERGDEAGVLRATGIHRRFALPRTGLFGRRAERHAVAGVDLELGPQRSLGVVGESGSGKTTLMRILLGLDRPTEGTVTYGGRPVEVGRPASMRWFRSEVQVVFQDPVSSLDPRLTVDEIVREPLRGLRIAEDHDERIVEVLRSVGLDPDTRWRLPHEFSGGQQQRIAIARALAPRPRVLIGDEPVSALDVSVRAQVLDLLADLRERYGLALVLVSHDLGVVRALCDEVLVLHQGQVVERGPVAEVFARPEHDYTRTLLAAVPRLP